MTKQEILLHVPAFINECKVKSITYKFDKDGFYIVSKNQIYYGGNYEIFENMTLEDFKQFILERLKESIKINSFVSNNNKLGVLKNVNRGQRIRIFTIDFIFDFIVYKILCDENKIYCISSNDVDELGSKETTIINKKSVLQIQLFDK